MKWVLTFIDVCVFVYFVFGCVVWGTAFPEYLRSDYSKKISKNNSELVVFLYEHWYNIWRHPYMSYGIWIKKQWVPIYHQIADVDLWKCYGDEQDAMPVVDVVRLKNGRKFIALETNRALYKSKGECGRTQNLLVLSNDGADTVVTSLRLQEKEDDVKDSAELLDEDLHGLVVDGRKETFCEIDDPRFKIPMFVRWEEFVSVESLRQENVMKSYLSDTANANALREAIGQMYLKPACVDSLVEYFKNSGVERKF